ncbi:trypsin-like serine peptidase [Maricaulis sp. D1M11]|uniref:trypsin-like serine peptidase n=1 Tax=Maricaulis sp. D1M11 TaxID=3076117 RepID=UPI0039B6CDDA
MRVLRHLFDQGLTRIARFMVIGTLGLVTTSLASAQLDDGPESRLSSRDINAYLARVQDKPVKPTGTSGTGRYQGNDSCQYAHDGECDDIGLGTGACEAGTDYSDCWRIAEGVEDDSCRWANDGECDEPLGLGTGACAQATDFSDCRDVTALRFRNDTCERAFDGVCNEPDGGDGRCEARTDRADCAGRERPLTINDHFFGHDDRRFMDTSTFPWSVVGTIDLDEGGTCTATLVGESVLITAAHCISGESRISARGEFTTGFDLPGGPRRARIIDYLVDRNWDDRRFNTTDDIDGTDWALLRIDTPLGAELGHVGVLELVDREGRRQARNARLLQAGYSWDTGSHLSGNEDCSIDQVYRDNTMAHNCDTTRGDSGSPFLVRDGDTYAVVATDSNFRRNPRGPMLYIAVRSEAWADQLAEFEAGRVGNTPDEGEVPGKPVKPVKVEDSAQSD